MSSSEAEQFRTISKTCHRQQIAGRNGQPHVFTYLDAELHAVSGLEQLGLGTQPDGGACQIDLRRIQVLGRGKPAFLVELVIVGQIGLGNHTEYAAPLHHNGTVQQQSSCLHGQSYHTDDVQLAGKLQQAYQSLLGLVQQQLLLEQVLTGVARQTEFRKTNNLHLLAVSQGDQFLHLLDVVLNVCYFHGGHSSRHFYKTIFHTSINFPDSTSHSDLGQRHFTISLWNEQRRVAIAQESEVVRQRIVIDLAPVALHKGAHQQ